MALKVWFGVRNELAIFGVQVIYDILSLIIIAVHIDQVNMYIVIYS